MTPIPLQLKNLGEIDFGKDPQNLQDEYLDVYKGIQSDIVSSKPV